MKAHQDLEEYQTLEKLSQEIRAILDDEQVCLKKH